MTMPSIFAATIGIISAYYPACPRPCSKQRLIDSSYFLASAGLPCRKLLWSF
jgi:hypothetical protein